VLLFRNTVTYLEINFHRRVAKDAEGIYFLFAAERPRRNGIIDLIVLINGRLPANKKKVYLCALCGFAVRSKIYGYIDK